jgi:hypothetical protein
MGKKYKNINEPTGGIDGMPQIEALAYAAAGKTVRRVGRGTKWELFFNGTLFMVRENGAEKPYKMDNPADYMSCDWYVVE